MHYSSVAHLSNQFKKITGLTPSYYKKLKLKKREIARKMCEWCNAFQKLYNIWMLLVFIFHLLNYMQMKEKNDEKEGYPYIWSDTFIVNLRKKRT